LNHEGLNEGLKTGSKNKKNDQFYGLKPGKKGFIKNAEASVEGLNEGLNSLLKTIRHYPGLQAPQLVAFLSKRSVKTIERQIRTLVVLGLFERRGSKKTGGYFVS